MTTKTNTKKGFTIIESLVAITILVISIVGAASAIQTGISSYIFSKDQIIAFYLAQGGFEQIRNIRDENSLTGEDWLTGLASVSGDPCYFGQSCIVDPVNTNQATRCDAPGECPVIRQENGTGFFGYDASWTPTIFTREISLSSINDHEVAITVTVSWSKGAISREFRARENILNWQ